MLPNVQGYVAVSSRNRFQTASSCSNKTLPATLHTKAYLIYIVGARKELRKGMIEKTTTISLPTLDVYRFVHAYNIYNNISHYNNVTTEHHTKVPWPSSSLKMCHPPSLLSLSRQKPNKESNKNNWN